MHKPFYGLFLPFFTLSAQAAEESPPDGGPLIQLIVFLCIVSAFVLGVYLFYRHATAKKIEEQEAVVLEKADYHAD